MDLMKSTKHRPWPLPTAPWIMAQRWLDLLFAHWPIKTETMRQLIPPQLELDTFDGEAWVGVVPFRMSDVHPRWVPSLPWLSAFPELNVRTYVKAKQGAPKPGVYFFSLEAANPVAVAIARKLFKLPYFNATMKLQEQEGIVKYTSHRTHRGAPAADFVGQYAPIGEVYLSEPKSFDAWLTERYSLYTVHNGHAFRGDIHHVQWPLQRAEAEFEVNSVAAASQVVLPDLSPVLHFARAIDVVVWPLVRVVDKS